MRQSYRALCRSIFRCAALPLVLPWLLYGQIQNLSAVNDGSVIFFNTRLRPRGSSDLPYPKVYRLDASGIHLVAATAFPTGSLSLGGWWVESASVSGDGKVVAVNSANPCSFGNGCIDITQEYSSFLIGTSPQRYRGRAQVSRGGRFAILTRTTGFGSIPQAGDLPARGISLLDLQTGALSPLGNLPASYGQWISAAGVTLVGIDTWTLISPGGTRQSLGDAPNALRAVLADDASFVVYQINPPQNSTVQATSPIRIRYVDGTDQLLAPEGAFPSISADSRRVLYLAPVEGKLQAFLFDRIALTNGQVSFEAEGLAEAVLTGNGEVAVATTGLGRLITLDVFSGARKELIGPVPDLGPIPLDAFSQPAPIQPAEAPGSLYTLTGQHLATATDGPTFPLPTQQDGVQILVAGVPAPLYQISPDQISYQIAWETPLTPSNTATAPAREIVLRSGDPSWEAVIPLDKISAFVPQIISLGSETVTTPFKHENTLYAIHGDWHGLVSSKDPAIVGEYVHFYATGFGPVAPAVPTGEPSPSTSPAKITTPCTWSISTDTSGLIRLEVPFAGLAPGFVGIYQITAKVPRGAVNGLFTPFCR